MESPAPAAPPAKSEVVSQSEIESLLASIGGGGGGAPGGPGPAAPAANQLNFPQASSFSASELRKLNLRHEEFVRSLAGRLSTHLRLECTLQMMKLETVTFKQFTESLGTPTHLTLLHVEPLAGLCLLDVPPRLGLCIVNRELGGPGEAPPEIRDLTGMEIKLAAQAIEMAASEWCAVWSDKLDLRPQIVRHENSAKFLNFHPADTLMLAISIEVKFGKVAELLRFALPCPTLKPLFAKLHTDGDDAPAAPAKDIAATLKWNPALAAVKIRVSAELTGLEFTARRLANLSAGEILPIASDLSEQVQVCLEGTPKFLGRLGTSGQHLAVQILRPV